MIPAVVGVNLFPRVARGGPDEMSAGVFRSFFLLYAGFCLLTVPLAPVVYPRALRRGLRRRRRPVLVARCPACSALGMLTVLSHHFAGRGFPLEAMLVWFVGLAVNVAMNLRCSTRTALDRVALVQRRVHDPARCCTCGCSPATSAATRALRPSPRETVRFVRVALSRR